VLTFLADLTPASAVSLGLIPVGAIWLALAFADADPRDFDPRPALARLVESGHIDPLLLIVGPVLLAVRETARDAAALLILLTTSPKGAMA